VDKLAHKWDAKLALLERLQVALKETPRHKARRCAKLKQRIGELAKEVAVLQVGALRVVLCWGAWGAACGRCASGAALVCM